jgi:hypothetical protein
MNQSMTDVHAPLPPSASPLARAVRAQRLDYELTIQHAANLSGLSIGLWEQLEEGTWIPDCCEETDAVARGIGANATTISFLALISRVGRWKYLN